MKQTCSICVFFDDNKSSKTLKVSFLFFFPFFLN